MSGLYSESERIRMLESRIFALKDDKQRLQERIDELEEFVQQVADHSNDTWLVQRAIRLGAQL